jgi:hypothetical protein
MSTHTHVVAFRQTTPSAVSGTDADAYRGRVHAARQGGQDSTFLTLCGSALSFSDDTPGHVVSADYPINCEACLAVLQRHHG